MFSNLVTVEQAATRLHLHPKTVLRYIRDGRLPATRVGKSYRIASAKLDAFGGGLGGQSETAAGARATCIVEIPDVAVDSAERLAIFLQSVAKASSANTPPIHLQTAFDPVAKSMKVVVITTPSNLSDVLGMLQIYLSNRS